MSYTGKTYSHEGIKVLGALPYAIETDNKRPAIAKRVYDTYSEALAYATNSGDTACPGLILTVTKDSVSTKNGAYMVMSGTTGMGLSRVGGAVSVREAATPTEGYLKSYEIVIDGVAAETKIDIPKDFFVKSASAYTISTAEEATEKNIPSGHTCLDLTINTKDNDGTETHTYVDLTATVKLDATLITATPIPASNDTVAISGTTVAQQLQAIGIQIKKNDTRLSQSGHTQEILHLYDDGLGIKEGAVWDCGEWT